MIFLFLFVSTASGSLSELGKKAALDLRMMDIKNPRVRPPGVSISTYHPDQKITLINRLTCGHLLTSIRPRTP
jgi:hypothetical protein